MYLSSSPAYHGPRRRLFCYSASWPGWISTAALLHGRPSHRARTSPTPKSIGCYNWLRITLEMTSLPTLLEQIMRPGRSSVPFFHFSGTPVSLSLVSHLVPVHPVPRPWFCLLCSRLLSCLLSAVGLARKSEPLETAVTF